MFQQVGSIFSHGQENELRDILGKMRIRQHAPRGGIDKVDVPLDEFLKCGFRPLASVFAQKLLIA